MIHRKLITTTALTVVLTVGGVLAASFEGWTVQAETAAPLSYDKN
ncbi:hypothetical protein [Halobacillus sp. A5]|nr:hypothetical protein [Halobacillus sp. A5]